MHLTNLPGRCEIKVIETCYADDFDAVKRFLLTEELVAR
jgi:hypothetical protein